MGYTLWKWAGAGTAIGTVFGRALAMSGRLKTKAHQWDALIQSALVFGSAGALLGFIREKSDALVKEKEFYLYLGSPDQQTFINPIAEKGIVAGIAGLSGLSGIVAGGLAGLMATAAYEEFTGKKVKQDTLVHAALGGAALFGLGAPAYILKSYVTMDEAPGDRL